LVVTHLIQSDISKDGVTFAYVVVDCLATVTGVYAAYHHVTVLRRIYNEYQRGYKLRSQTIGSEGEVKLKSKDPVVQLAKSIRDLDAIKFTLLLVVLEDIPTLVLNLILIFRHNVVSVTIFVSLSISYVLLGYKIRHLWRYLLISLKKHRLESVLNNQAQELPLHVSVSKPGWVGQQPSPLPKEQEVQLAEH